MWSPDLMSTPKLAHLLVTLPLVAVPMTLVAAKPSQAAVTAAEEAVRLLSKAQAEDRRCGFLSGAERSELSRYADRARAAATAQSSALAARGGAAAGMSEGRASGCSEDLRADVRETLEAARAAAAEANRASAPRPASAALAAGGRDDPPATVRGLGFYASVVGAYYLERRCRSLSRSDAERFWKGVVRIHREAMAEHGQAAVARVMLKAERDAAASACGSRAIARIGRGYEQLSSR
jgi:hypothetical protein